MRREAALPGPAVPDSWTVLRLIDWTGTYLREKGIEEPRLNAELLLAGALGLKRLELYLQFDRPLSPEELSEFKGRLRRRVRHEPLQYIAGTAHFRELMLEVDPRVLIPRPETEVLVGEVLRWAEGRPGLDAVDVGTGSGAIALSLRAEGSFARVLATDASAAALEVACANQRRLLPDAELEFREGRGYAPLGVERFDVIVSNPPYVPEADRAVLPAGVRDWEPAEALFAGEDGLAVIRDLVGSAPRHLRPGGLLALEVGDGQAESVVRLIRETDRLMRATLRPDLRGRDRIVLAELESESAR